MSTRSPHHTAMSSAETRQQTIEADLALCRRASQGDRPALRTLADRVAPRARTTASFLARSRADAEDIVQLSMIQILRSAGSYRGLGPLERWVDRLVIRTAMRILKARHRKLEVPVAEMPALPLPGFLENEVEGRQIFEHLLALIQRLTPKRRLVAMLCLVHEYSLSEVVEITDLPLNTVRDRLRMARKKLRMMIASDPVLQDWAKARER